MKNRLKQLKNIILVLWNRHHFIIPPKYWKKYLKYIKRKLTGNKEYYHPFIVNDYNQWLNKNKKQKHKKENFEYNPLISFVIPVYNIEPDYLKDCLNSILEQTYENFEVCLADDHSTREETINTLKNYEKIDKRIRVVYRKENGHISKATNSALEIAKGEFIALMDDDDILREDALYQIVSVLNKDKTIDFIYSDEDKIDMDGNYCEPHFKNDFSKDSFFGGNYICHLTVISKKIFDKIGNFNEEYVGAQDFDLFLRATEVAKNIYHIPQMLYHWRKVPGSTADTIENKEYAIDNGKKAVEAAIKRRKLDAYVTVPMKTTHYVVHYNIRNNPKVSIIMLDTNKDIAINNIKEIKKCNYKELEIIINKKYDIDKLNNKKIIFNDEKNINKLIDKCNGKYILIISGKIKIDNKNIINEMLGYASQNDIGVVGPKIYNFGKTIKSAGLILNSKKIYIDAFSNYFCDSTGIYGRLLVPYNYSALSYTMIMFSKDKYNQVNGFIDNMDYKLSSVDFCLKMLENNYSNVLLSYLYIYQKDYKVKFDFTEKDGNILREKWDLDNDKFYNENLSKNYPFMLPYEVNDEKK